MMIFNFLNKNYLQKITYRKEIYTIIKFIESALKMNY
jgi:hypothetical protein